MVKRFQYLLTGWVRSRHEVDTVASQPTERRLRILYIDGVGPFGGASRSLFELISAEPLRDTDMFFVAARGTAVDQYRKRTKEIITARGLFRFDNTKYSYYRGVRWFVILREIINIPGTILSILIARSRWKNVDAIHVNEITELFTGILAKICFRAPIIVHVRSPQRVSSRSIRVFLINRVLKRYVDRVIAIDENVRSTLPHDLNVEVIHNSFSQLGNARADSGIEERFASLKPSLVKVGFVGNLHQAKGLWDLVEAARLVREKNGNVVFIVVGGDTASEKGLKRRILKLLGLAQNISNELGSYIADNNMDSYFYLFGPTFNIQGVYERIDILTFPSHFDSPGRPVFEAAFSGVPAIVAVTQPRSDTLVHMETGIAIQAKNPRELAEAILYYSERPHEIRRMGANAKALANENFVVEKNARLVRDVYDDLVVKDKISDTNES